MKSTIRLGRIRGIKIGAHWSVIVIAALLASGLATGILPETAPHLSTAAYWVTASVVAVLFIAALLAHEMSHAVLAKRNGIEVVGITLWMLGGVTEMRDQPKTARADLRIAASGPLMSALIGVAFVLLAFVTDVTGAPRLVTGACGWLGTANLILAVFNLLPGAPLDGGRVLRAALWARYGDRDRAAATASRAGHALGLGLMFAGLAVAWTFDAISGLWLMLLGWFISSAATAEGNAEVAVHLLSGVHVGDAMTRDVPELPAYLTLDRAAGRALEVPSDIFRATDFAGVVVGLVTRESIARVPDDVFDQLHVRDIMVPLDRLPTVAAGDDLAEVLPRIGGRTAVVVDNGYVVGVLTRRDVTAAFQRAELRRHDAQHVGQAG